MREFMFSAQAMRAALLFLTATAVLGAAIEDSHLESYKKATTDKKGVYHVIFREVLQGSQQADWTNVYGAKVEVQRRKADGTYECIKTFTGSTVPNAIATGMPDGWQYAVVLSNNSQGLPMVERNRYYTWTSAYRAPPRQTKRCLRLAPQVPTIHVGSQRIAEGCLAKLREGIDAGACKYATNILVHAGGEYTRGSEGCLTIKKSEADAFFALIPEGATGTLEVLRGVRTSTSTEHF